MTFFSRVDDELKGAYQQAREALPSAQVFDALSPSARRETVEALNNEGEPPMRGRSESNRSQRLRINGLDGNPSLDVVVTPAALGKIVDGVVLFIHGGGMWTGSANDLSEIQQRVANEIGVDVISVDYRLAPENPYPAALDDCLAALQWITSSQGYARNKVVVYGPSAGGGLAVATALRARDHGGPEIQLVVAEYPMLSAETSVEDVHEFSHLHPAVWDTQANQEAWAWYLGGQAPDDYSSPSTATDLRGLPPMFIDVGDIDLFRDESLSFAGRLAAAGVPVEFHMYPGLFHGADALAPNALISRRMLQTRLEAIDRAFRQP